MGSPSRRRWRVCCAPRLLPCPAHAGGAERPAAGAALPGPRRAHAQGHHRVARSAALLRPGPRFMFAFNHDEAIRSFRARGELDPNCAMAWWGVAIANGPHINNPVVPPKSARQRPGTRSRGRAPRRRSASPVERALIEAQAALRQSAARGPQRRSTGRMPTRCARSGRAPAGRRHRRAVRRVDGGPAAVGPVDRRTASRSPAPRR